MNAEDAYECKKHFIGNIGIFVFLIGFYMECRSPWKKKNKKQKMCYQDLLCFVVFYTFFVCIKQNKTCKTKWFSPYKTK